MVIVAFFVGRTPCPLGSKMSLEPEAIEYRCDLMGIYSLCSLGFAELASECSSDVRLLTRNMAAGAGMEMLREGSRTDAADMTFLLSQ